MSYKVVTAEPNGSIVTWYTDEEPNPDLISLKGKPSGSWVTITKDPFNELPGLAPQPKEEK